MIIIVAVLLGIALGIRAAKKNDGQRLDMLQYATGYAIAFGLIGIVVTLLLDRLVF
ncbi:MAG: hypothetical protein ACU0BB_01380 [Paracoccaceae bacterium]|jgi:hypothetical protein